MTTGTDIQISFEADTVDLGAGITAVSVLKVRNLSNAALSVTVACALNSSPGKESSRAWTSPTVTGVTGNDASGSSSISDVVSIGANKEVTYYLVSTMAALGAYTHAVTTLKATATVASVVRDTAVLRLYQGNMDYATFKEGVEPNAVQIAEKLFDVGRVHPEFVDFLENAGGKTIWDLI